MMQLYCVGCSGKLFTPENALDTLEHTMILSCSCGASSPIITSDIESPNAYYLILPSSLIRILSRHKTNRPHLEYYLGYSDIYSPSKTIWIERLTSSIYDLTSQKDCPQEYCQRQYQREIDRLLQKEK